MIQDLGVASTPSQVGFYSGLVVRSSSFFSKVGRLAVYGERDQRIPLLTLYYTQSGVSVCCIPAVDHSSLCSAFRSAGSLDILIRTNMLLDVIGRRPVILVGVVGLALATFVFGLSKTFVAILITRCLGTLLVVGPLG